MTGGENLNNAVQYFVSGVLALCDMVMRFLGNIDAALGAVMTSVGIHAHWQFLIMLVVTVILVVLALRLVGGLLGWMVLLLLVLLLLHRVVPGIASPGTIVPGQLANLL
jgi:hypothetical protein